MKNSARLFLSALVGSLILVYAPKAALAQDPVKVAPASFKVLLEKDRVRVLESRLQPGAKESMHSHPASAIYFLSSFKVKFSYPDGKTAEAEGKPGQVLWTESVTHAAENIGTTEAHVLIVELKEPKKMEK